MLTLQRSMEMPETLIQETSILLWQINFNPNTIPLWLSHSHRSIRRQKQRLLEQHRQYDQLPIKQHQQYDQLLIKQLQQYDQRLILLVNMLEKHMIKQLQQYDQLLILLVNMLEKQ